MAKRTMAGGVCLAVALSVTAVSQVAASPLHPPVAAPVAAAAPAGVAYNPVAGNQGFDVFIKGNSELNAGAITGGFATGGTLSVSPVDLASQRPVTVTSAVAGHLRTAITDGDPTTYWQSATGFPQTMTIDLGSSMIVSYSLMRYPTAGRVTKFTLDYSTDGTTFNQASISTYVDGADQRIQVIQFVTEVTARYLRINFVADAGNTASNAAVSEWEVYRSNSSPREVPVGADGVSTFRDSVDAAGTQVGVLVGGRANIAGWGNGYVTAATGTTIKIGDVSGTDIKADGTKAVVVNRGNTTVSPALRTAGDQPASTVLRPGLVDFNRAFAAYSARAVGLAQCANTVTANISFGTAVISFDTSGAPKQYVWNVTAAELASVVNIQLLNVPSRDFPLVINVDTTGSNNFAWAQPNIYGTGVTFATGAYVLFNFPTATQIDIAQGQNTLGTLFAPRATLLLHPNGQIIHGGVVAAALVLGDRTGNNPETIKRTPLDMSVQSCGPAAAIVKVATPSTYVGRGGTVTYTVTITNVGVAFAGGTYTDNLSGVTDDATYNNDAVATAGGISWNAGTSTLTWAGDLAADQVATVTYSVLVNKTTGNGKLVNTITSGPGTNCGTNPDASCTSTVQIIPSVTIVKTASPASYVPPGGKVTYTVTITNDVLANPGAAFTDNLTGVIDDATYNSDVTDGGAGGSFDWNPTTSRLSWRLDMTPNQVVTVTYSVTANKTGDGQLVNQVTTENYVSNCSPGPDTRCRKTVPVSSTPPSMTIVKSASPAASVAPQGTVTYTVTVTNGSIAFTGAAFTDNLTGVVDDATYNLDAVATAGSVTWNAGASTINWSGSLTPGQVFTVTYSVKVNRTGNGQLLNSVSTASGASNCSPGPDSRCTKTVAVASTITLTMVTDNFSLSGPPGSTPGLADAITMKVVTDSLTGYQVLVKGSAPQLLPVTGTNPDRIAISNLLVRDYQSTFRPLSDSVLVTVRRQTAPSAVGGDQFGNDYRATIPFVRPDQYQTTLEYVAGTL
ncbi:hypothetical protein GCM10009682_03970 [Luedemannella flava]|uniref:F5/8 type C domain-containing protein n=2 Tax=Luedemannella flava TaxID=349316 RepID=A0ABP4XJB7_9ACTN